MAEAHQAVAFSFNLAPGGGIHFYYDTALLQDIWHSYVRSWRHKTVRFRNNINNNVFPLKTWSYMVFLLVATVLMLNPIKPIRDPTFGFATILKNKVASKSAQLSANPFYERLLQIAFVYIFYLLLWLACIQLLRWFINILLRYRNIMYERRNMSWRTKLWLVAIRLVTKVTTPTLYSYQGILPRLPLPSLRDTLARHLKTVRPLLSDAEFDNMVQLSAAFEQNEGRKFQRYVWFKWLLSSNYVSDWWERFVYLRSRSPLLVNSNFYAMDNLRVSLTSRQTSRAANVIYSMLKFRDILQREDWKPMMLGDIMPLCSWQHMRQFDTTRIPGIENDTMRHLPSSATHVAVVHRGRWFQLTTHYRGQRLQPCELEAQLEIIVNDRSLPAPGEARLAALTAGDRAHWATTRQQFFMRGGVNNMSLNAIECAAFVVALDDAEHVYDPDDASQLDEYGHWMLCGDGTNRWCDKTYTAVILKNGRIGVNVEHSWSDAPVTGVMWEYIIVEDLAVCGYTDDGRCRGTPRQLQPSPAPPLRLQFVLNETCCEHIDKSYVVARSLVENTNLVILHFSEYGKAFMKTCKVSPDGFIQLVLQLAYFRDVGRLDLTYEACMTRLVSCTNLLNTTRVLKRGVLHVFVFMHTVYQRPYGNGPLRVQRFCRICLRYGFERFDRCRTSSFVESCMRLSSDTVFGLYEWQRHRQAFVYFVCYIKVFERTVAVFGCRHYGTVAFVDKSDAAWADGPYRCE